MKIERNAPCPCGSGKKYKKCCYLSAQNNSEKVNIESKNDVDIEAQADDFNEYEEQDGEISILGAFYNMHKYYLSKKVHIKKYYALRKIHGEIINAMINYFHEGKFQKTFDANRLYINPSGEKLQLIENDFDLNTELGKNCFHDLLIYKVSPNIDCIIDEFIRKHHYRKPEKIAFLQSMLNSRKGLFESTEVDSNNGYVYLKEVFTGDEYKITDVAMSRNLKTEYYYYIRIITCEEISFNGGINMIFEKNDEFIKEHIAEHKKNYIPESETFRFLQLYSQTIKHPSDIKLYTNKI